LRRQILRGIYNLSQIVLGANSLVQSVIPTLFQPTPGSAAAQELQEFHNRYVRTLEENAHYVRTRVAEIPGLDVMVPEGAMYAMVSPHTAALVQSWQPRLG
jgi:tyrosine aminotransferase